MRTAIVVFVLLLLGALAAKFSRPADRAEAALTMAWLSFSALVALGVTYAIFSGPFPTSQARVGFEPFEQKLGDPGSRSD